MTQQILRIFPCLLAAMALSACDDDDPVMTDMGPVILEPEPTPPQPEPEPTPPQPEPEPEEARVVADIELTFEDGTNVSVGEVGTIRPSQVSFSAFTENCVDCHVLLMFQQLDGLECVLDTVPGDAPGISEVLQGQVLIGQLGETAIRMGALIADDCDDALAQVRGGQVELDQVATVIGQVSPCEVACDTLADCAASDDFCDALDAASRDELARNCNETCAANAALAAVIEGQDDCAGVIETVRSLNAEFDAICDDELPPLQVDQVVRLAWQWTVTVDGPIYSSFAKVHPVVYSDLARTPEPIEAILRSRRLIGGDCVAYVEDDQSDRIDGWPAPAPAQTDIGAIATSFRYADGGEHVGHRSTLVGQRYTSFSDFDRRDGRQSAGQVLFAGAVDQAADGGTDRSFGIADGRNARPVWDLAGFQAGMVTQTSEGAFLSFDMMGARMRAHVHCAKEVVDEGGRRVARITVPDLSALADEIELLADEAPAVTSCGATSIGDPLLGGHYGIAEQAVRGLATVLEQRNGPGGGCITDAN